MMPRRLAIRLATSIGLGAALLFLLRGGDKAEDPKALPSQLADSPADDAKQGARPKARQEEPPPESEKESKKRRYQELKSRLQAAATKRQERQHSKAPSTSDMEVPRFASAHLDKEYIQAQMKEILPLFRECYEQALELDQSLAGKVVIRSTIIGEEEIGGLVESSEVLLDQSEISAPAFLECVQESIYALELPAPEGGGTVTLTYPMLFSQDEEEPG